MNKMIARTALVATLALSALSLSACGTNNDCAHAAQSNTVTATTAMFATKGGGGHASGHGGESAHGETSTGAHEESSTGSTSEFHWFWMGNGSHSDQCPNPAPSSKS